MNATADIVSDINADLGRYIEQGPKRGWSLFTFKRVSDETYQFVTTGVTEARAREWLAGASLAHTTHPAPQRTEKVCVDLTAADRETLSRDLGALPPTPARQKLLNALAQ